MVTAISGASVTGILMCEYMYDGSGAYTSTMIGTGISAGNVQHISSRKFLNQYTIMGDFVSGSTTVSNVKYVYSGANAAYNFEVNTPLFNGDGYWGYSNAPVSSTAYITSIDSAANTITVSGAALEDGTFVVQNCVTAEGDNLGDHHLRKNLRTKNNWISNDGDNECL